MNEWYRPICYAHLEVREVAPCWDCGASPVELDHLAEGRHTFAEYVIFGATIVLCDFCRVDFGSYAAEYFGQHHRVSYGRGMTFVRDIPAVGLSNDKYCATCGRRLKFLQFLARVRENGATEK